MMWLYIFEGFIGVAVVFCLVMAVKDERSMVIVSVVYGRKRKDILMKNTEK